MLVDWRNADCLFLQRCRSNLLSMSSTSCRGLILMGLFKQTWAPLNAKQELKKEHIKKRLLGHFGTCPGLSLVYAHTSLLIKETEEKMMVVWGPGHGAPGVLSCLYLEGSITRFYGQYPQTKPGLDKFVKAFSWPGGWPSHINAETPGASTYCGSELILVCLFLTYDYLVHEGGELGYALAVAYGSVMDSPDLITVAVVSFLDLH